MTMDEQQLQQQLRGEEQRLDTTTVANLSRARETALGGKSPRQHQLFRPALGGLALASVIALILVLPTHNTPTTPKDSEDLYENIDFYSWMAESDHKLQDLYDNIDFYHWLAETELNTKSQS